MPFLDRTLNKLREADDCLAQWHKARLYPELQMRWPRAANWAMTWEARLHDRRRHPRRRSYARQSSRQYWNRRGKALHAWFWVASRVYLQRTRLRERRQAFSVTRSLLGTIAPQVLFATILVISLGFLEHRQLTPWITGTLNASSYDYILSTLAQVAGIFIGFTLLRSTWLPARSTLASPATFAQWWSPKSLGIFM
jgi:hypothetical protein